ncbi:hypothetical protein Phum_PHUM256950 [Pediculus humanus corporis]|uniref:Uncharacterized protein n=1 Tax=Pediculus humanus subsp. corporis TaxID=121224 RepID=E0VK51_PEDHC|nr:uncharacterized protein Phum_PHUM256950 [Pediculus humanus corporis]EEB13757.1 hypothetical protein Phum_PHUM256950 [Pediculus humanus corporis]
MDDLNLNEGAYNRIQNVLDASKTENINYPESCFKSIYSPATLINNWQEFRNDNEVPVTTTEPMISEHMDQFRCQCESKVPDRGEYYNKIFEGYGLGQELLIDHMGFSYYGNYTTTYDLCFNHLPKGICGPYPRFYHKGKYKPSTDLTLIYGNLTNWGLRERLQNIDD